MKVIFLKNIPGKARTGEIKEVSIGYLNNYLLPNHLATVATAAAIKEATLRAQKQKESEEKEAAALKVIAAQLKELVLNFSLKFSSYDDDTTKEILAEKAFDSVNVQRIIDALKEKGINLQRNQIKLDKPLKTVGQYTIEVNLLPKEKTFVKINITSAIKNAH